MANNLNKVSHLISLEKTENFCISKSFRKGEGFGNFYLIDKRIEDFTDTIQISPSVELASYELTVGEVSEESVINDAIDQKIYTELDMAHVWQIFQRDIKGEGLMNEDKVSGFLVRNKYKMLCIVNIFLIENEGWYLNIEIHADKNQSSSEEYFFLNMPTITG